MSADDGLTQQQIEDGIRKELLKLQAATADADQTAAFAGAWRLGTVRLCR